MSNSNMTGAAAPTFLDLRNTLPDELKLEILKYTVPSGESYCDVNFQVLNFLVSYSEPALALKYHVVPLLSLSCPSIKPLVIEAFYSQNSFFLMQSEFDLTGFYYPARSVNRYNRAISIWICYNDRWPIEFLSRIAKGELGFARLRSVKIVMSGGQYKVPADSFCEFLEWFGTITFSVGILKIEYRHDKHVKTAVDEQEMLVLDKLTIEGEESKVKSEVTRFYAHEEGSFMDVWPDREELGRHRVTKKVLEIGGRSRGGLIFRLDLS
jgi:hypothetical protein